ncbi:MAG: 50S ribosomal protein L29 [Spirochaetaceae bacterium]|jgi:large subunit ribosomal protein L29|nr:50S ribosomal protein L29 [Spirochaetaceae bacterium]
MVKKKENKELTYSELLVKRNELKKKYMEFRFQKINGHVENPLLARTYRREIAALNTFIRQKELAGQTVAPALEKAAGQAKQEARHG